MSLHELQKADIDAALKKHDGEARVWQTGPEVWEPLRDVDILIAGEEGMGISFQGTKIQGTTAARGATFVEKKHNQRHGICCRA